MFTSLHTLSPVYLTDLFNERSSYYSGSKIQVTFPQVRVQVTMTQINEQGMRSVHTSARLPVKVFKTLNGWQFYILSKFHKIERFQLILTIICRFRKVKRS